MACAKTPERPPDTSAISNLPFDPGLRGGHNRVCLSWSVAMHILCPHCQNPIELITIRPYEEIACPSCGSSFRLVTQSTTGHEQRTGQRLGKFELIDTVGSGAF